MPKPLKTLIAYLPRRRPTLPSTPARPPRTRPHDLLAAYRRPELGYTLPSFEAVPEVAKQDDTAFGTISTAPAGATLQEVPKPGSDIVAKIERAVPAMRDSPPVIATGESRSISRGEIFVHGVVIPPRPVPPGEEECCMSGCVHCVYTIYADDFQLYTDALADAKKALERDHVSKADWPESVRALDQVGTGEMVEAERSKVEESLDPTLAAFLALEGRLKKKQAPSAEAAT